MSETQITITEAALKTYSDTVRKEAIEQGYQMGLNRMHAASQDWIKASLDLCRIVYYVESIGINSGGETTRISAALNKAEMMKRLDLLRTCMGDISQKYGIRIVWDSVEPLFNYTHELFNLATRYVEAQQDAQPYHQRALADFVDRENPTGSLHELLYKIDMRELDPVEMAILAFHREHYRRHDRCKTHAATARHFVHIMNGLAERDEGEQIALNILLPMTDSDRAKFWGDAVRDNRHRKLPEKSGKS